MNLKTLESFIHIESSIELLREEIEEADGLYIKGIDNASGGLSGKGAISNPTQQIIIKRLELRKRLLEEINKKYALREEIMNYINSLDLDEARNIFRLKYLRNLSHRQIGEKLHMHHTTVSRRLNFYIRKYKLK